MYSIRFWLLAFLFWTDSSVNGHYYTEQFTDNIDQFALWAQQFSQWIFPYFEEIASKSNLTTECHRALRTLVQHPNREWASLMIDSSGRILRPGFLSGTITDYGDYDQCMSIQRVPDQTLQHVSARYCFLTARPPIPPPDADLDFNQSTYHDSWISKRLAKPAYRFYFRIDSAICFPSVCHQNEIEEFARTVLKKFRLEVTVDNCQSSTNQVSLDFAQILSIAILLASVAAVTMGTIVDCCCCCPKTTSAQPVASVQFWSCFSLIQNSKNLFSIKPSTPTDLSCLHGLRVLLILWVILCHTTNFAPLGLYDQPIIVARFSDDIRIGKQLLTQFVISGSLSVQGFFVISGLISLHTLLKDPESFSKTVTYWKYVLFRWLRFTPPLIGMFCYQFVWPLLTNGPLVHWDFLKYGHEPCYKNWYANFLYLSNWFRLVDQCGSHTWYLSADFQINLVVYFLIVLYIRNYTLALRCNLVALVVASVGPTVINWYYNAPLVHIIEPDMDKLNFTISMIEFNTYNHFAAYLAGILVAALVHRSHKITLPKPTVNLAWMISLSLLLVVPFSTYFFIQLDNIPASFPALIYTGLKRFLFITPFSWLIYACCTCSKEGLLSRVLSAGIFQPFSRLTFSIYLTQSLVVWYYAYSSRELHFISHYNALFRMGGVIFFSLIFAFILYILFEAPSVNICKLIFKKQSNTKANLVLIGDGENCCLEDEKESNKTEWLESSKRNPCTKID